MVCELSHTKGPKKTRVLYTLAVKRGIVFVVSVNIFLVKISFIKIFINSLIYFCDTDFDPLIKKKSVVRLNLRHANGND